MKLKIGILTFIQPQNKNYGAVLQAYALNEVVQQLGYKTELIDIRDKGNEKSLFYLAKTQIRNLLEKNPFRVFLKKHVLLSKPLYSYTELKKQTKEYMAVIVGSDQVWRPEYCGKLAIHYFLDFVPQNVKRVAYAASFGVDQWTVDDQTTGRIHEEIHKFKAVSVREINGVDICEDVFGINASHTLDPTLLADKKIFHNLLVQCNNEQKYIASFILDTNNETLKIESFISKKLNIPIRLLNKSKVRFFGYHLTNYKTVEEWLRSIRDAEIIITDSFHGVCFSLIFEKKFVCIVNKGRGLSRLNSLLKLVGLENKMVTNIEQMKKSKYWSSEINYIEVNNKLKHLQQVSKDFLNNALR